MAATRFIVLTLALIVGGWFVFDGSRALVTGDYVTAKTGPRAGQLGPWAKLVSVVGIDPRGTLMKVVHVAIGLMWIGGALLFATMPDRGRGILLISSAASLWYAPMGTILGLAEIGMLIYLKSK